MSLNFPKLVCVDFVSHHRTAKFIFKPMEEESNIFNQIRITIIIRHQKPRMLIRHLILFSEAQADDLIIEKHHFSIVSYMNLDCGCESLLDIWLMGWRLAAGILHVCNIY